LIGAGDIVGDLRAQFLGAAEFLLFAKSVPKSNSMRLGAAAN